MSTKLESIVKELAKEKAEFVLPLDTYTKVCYERNGTTRLLAITMRGVEIPLTSPIDTKKIGHEQQESFLESLYSARESSGKQIEWALRFGGYTKDKTFTQTLKNLLTFGSISNKENEILDSMAMSYLGWAVLHEASEILARNIQIAKLSDFYGEITQISKPIIKKMYLDYSQILSMNGFANPIFKADLEMYKSGIILSSRDKKKTQTVSR